MFPYTPVGREYEGLFYHTVGSVKAPSVHFGLHFVRKFHNLGFFELEVNSFISELNYGSLDSIIKPSYCC